MGNSNSNVNLDFEYNIKASDYTPLHKYNDFLLGEFFEVKNTSTQDILLLKVRSFEDQQKYKQAVDACYKRLSISHKHLAKLHGFGGQDANRSQGNSYRIYVYFQTLPKDLARVLRDRKTQIPSAMQVRQSKRYFSEGELYNILFQLVEVMEYLQVNGISHGDIRPEACFMKSSGEMLICDRKITYVEEFQPFSEKNSERNYLLSPANLKAYVKGEKGVRENEFKSDVFSLGMTILECATFRRSTHIYEWGTNPYLNTEVLFSRLGDVSKRYSQRIAQILTEMLRFEEHQRPDFIKIKRWLVGTETLGHHTLISSTQEKLNPQLSKLLIGPKLLNTATKGSRVSRNSSTDTGRIASKTLENDDSDLPIPSPESGRLKKNFFEKDDEDEVVEFETEETLKQNTNGLDQSRGESNQYSLKSTVTESPQEDFRQKALHTSRHGANNILKNLFGNSPVIPFYDHKHTISHQLPKNEKPEGPRIRQTSGQTTRPSLGSESNILEGLHSPNKKYSAAYDSYQQKKPIYEEAFMHPSLQPLATRAKTTPHTYSNAQEISMPIFTSGEKHEYSSPTGRKTYSPNVGPIRLTSTTTNTTNGEVNRDSFGSQLDTPAKKLSIKVPTENHQTIVAEMKTSNMEFLQSKLQPSHKEPFVVVSPLPSHFDFLSPTHSQGVIDVPDWTPSRHNDNENKLDTSLSFDLGAEPEKWRSLVVDGMTYNSLSSVGGPETPRKMLTTSTASDLLSQQIHSHKPYQTHHQYSLSSNEKTLKMSVDNLTHRPVRSSRPSIEDIDHILGGEQPKKNVGYGHSSPNTRKSSNFPATTRHFAFDSSPMAKLKDSEVEEKFKRAMERSKETYSMYNYNIGGVNGQHVPYKK